MKTNIFVKGLLMVSGIIGMGIGFALLFSPVGFEASAGIDLNQNINLLSEIRAPGGLLIVAGIIIILGVFVSKFTYRSLLLSCVVYLSYGLSRFISILFDGFPSDPLLTAFIVELLVGLASLLVLVRFNRKQIKLK